MPSQPVRGSLVVTKTVNIKASRTGGRRKKRSKQRVVTNTSRVRRRRVNATAQSESSESRSDDAVAESSQAQSLENVDHMHLEDSCFSSPEATLHGTVDSSYDMYRSMLMAAPAHRCVRVADNTRGVQCLAVATGVQAASGVHIKDQLEHVLCIPMAFMASPDGIPDRHVVFVCSCSDMASNVESAVSRQTARMTYADFHAHAKPCWHASAAKDLSLDEADCLHDDRASVVVAAHQCEPFVATGR